MASGNYPGPNIYPSLPGYDNVPKAWPVDDGRGNFAPMTTDPQQDRKHHAHPHPNMFQPVMPAHGNQPSQPQAYPQAQPPAQPPAQTNYLPAGYSNYAPNYQPPRFYQDHTQMVRPAAQYGKSTSRKICGLNANRIMFTGIILWVISVIGYAVPNFYVNGIAGGLNFIAIICMLVPCIWGHNCCEHDDHSCCYGEYQ